MWNEELDPTKPKFKNRVGTEDALIQLQPLGGSRNSPSTLFCDLVHGFGAHEEETCGRSDIPAQKRCRATGCTQVYPCHVGLTDIAVPVMCEDQYLGTLFSGQVLTQPPTKEGFELVRASLAGQPHIDFNGLEAAYYRVPVVSPAQLAEMVRVLELFARYISNSWKRLQIMSEVQRTQDRQLALDRRELAALLLSGGAVDRSELTDLARRAGVRQLPDRVLVVHIERVNPAQGSLPQLSDQMTLHRLSHAVEDLCQTWTNTIAMAVRPGELCIMTAREARNPGHEQLRVEEMADALLAKVRSLGGARARIGISASHASTSDLVRAYQEACAAVESNASAVKFFDGPPAPSSLSTELLEPLLKAIRDGVRVATAVREFLADALPRDNSPVGLQQSRAFLTWSIEHINLEVAGMGASSGELGIAKEQTLTAVLHAPTPFSACEAFGNYVKLAAQQVASTFSDREQKIVLSVRQLIEERGVAQLSIKEIAAALRLSAGHLSRIYRRATGVTLEGYLILQRVELAKRALLDPRLNVAEVAERCGFCNPAYFAYVFKKYVNCTPREFARRPHFWGRHEVGRSCVSQSQ
jgi:AraC-like DNA-binding protein